MQCSLGVEKCTLNLVSVVQRGAGVEKCTLYRAMQCSTGIEKCTLCITFTLRENLEGEGYTYSF